MTICEITPAVAESHALFLSEGELQDKEDPNYHPHAVSLFADREVVLASEFADELSIPHTPAMTPLSTRVWMATIQRYELDFAFIDGPQGETYLHNRSIVAIRWPAGIIWPKPRTPKRAPTREELLARLAQSQAQPDPVPSLLRPRARRR